MKRTPPRRGLELPTIRLELVEDVSPGQASGFLKLIRQRYRAHYPDGTSSQHFLYDSVDRRAIDAVVICAHYSTPEGSYVYLRSCLRPPLFARPKSREPFEVPEPLGALWELPAGLVEERDQTPEGPALTAQRELFEELGFRVPIEAVHPLGFPILPSPGFVAEQQFFFHVEVDPAARTEPSLDGSPLEHCGRVIALPLQEALQLCRQGSFQDGKTEIGLRRLAEKFTEEFA